MSTISKKLVGFLYSGDAQTLAAANWKTNANAVYGINSAGTGYQVFKPGNTFNSLTQLAPDGVYILDAATLGFELPGATLTVSPSGGTAASMLRLDNFLPSFSGGYDNLTLAISSPNATDREYLLVFDSPGSYSYKLALNEAITLSVPNVVAGQVVTLTAVAPSGARLTYTFTVGE